MCCISLACSMHRDTARKVIHCSNKLQRGTCAKNTVRFLKNDPILTCSQCTVPILPYAAPLPSESLLCDNDGHFTAAARDDADLERSCTQGNSLLPLSISQLQLPFPIPSRSRPVSTQLDFQLPGSVQINNDDLRELSHEDGIQLIDEMYGAEDLDYSIEDMETSDDKIFYVSAGTHLDLEQTHNLIDDQREIIHNDTKGALVDTSICITLQHEATPIEVEDTRKIDIEASMIEARELLDRAQQELDRLRHARQEIESDFLWCLEKYTTSTQVWLTAGCEFLSPERGSMSANM